MSDTNNIIFDCPECRQGIKAPANMAGEMAPCPYCGKNVKVPKPASKDDDFKPALPLQPVLSTITDAQSGTIQQLNKKSKGLAIAGLVLGILSIVPVLFCGGPIWAILGIISSAIARHRISHKPEQYEGETLAVAGLITSIVGLVLNLFAIFMFGFMGATLTKLLVTFANTLPTLPK